MRTEKFIAQLLRTLVPLGRLLFQRQRAGAPPPGPKAPTRHQLPQAPPLPVAAPPPGAPILPYFFALGLTAASFAAGYTTSAWMGVGGREGGGGPPAARVAPPQPVEGTLEDPFALGTGALRHKHMGLGYSAEYDATTRNPRWVAEHMTAASLAKNAQREGSEFHEETSLPPGRRARLSAYVGSGYDRGHLAAAAAHRSSPIELADTFTLANVAPQDPKLNREYWARLEKWTRELVAAGSGSGSGSSAPTLEGGGGKTWDNVHVITGPLYLPSPASSSSSAPHPHYEYKFPALGAPLQWVAVPTHFFKVLVAYDGSNPTASALAAAAFVLPNAPVSSATPLASFAVPLGVLEAVSGLSFFPGALGEEDKAALDGSVSRAAVPHPERNVVEVFRLPPFKDAPGSSSSVLAHFAHHFPAHEATTGGSSKGGRGEKAAPAAALVEAQSSAGGATAPSTTRGGGSSSSSSSSSSKSASATFGSGGRRNRGAYHLCNVSSCALPGVDFFKNA
jgi:endonuclease G